MKIPNLETPRLLLRQLVMEDHVAIQKYFPHWDIVKYLTKAIPWPYPSDGAYHFLKNVALPAMEKGEEWFWGIILKSNPNEIIGVVHLRKEHTIKGNMGFWLALEFQNQGLMTEAVVAVSDYVFHKLNFNFLIITNAKENIASRRIKEKLVMKLIDTKEDIDYIGGYRQSEIWKITKDEWSKRKAKE